MRKRAAELEITKAGQQGQAASTGKPEKYQDLASQGQ
jgi:hypothetical protein